MASRSRSIEPKTPCSASVLCGGTRSNGITRMGFLQVSGCLYYRTNVCLFLGDLDPPLLQRIRNLLRGHGAEETSLRAGARLDLQDQARQRLRQVLGLFLLAAAPLLLRPLPRLAVAGRPFGRLTGQLPGKEVVPGIPFLHLDQRAGAPQHGNVLQKNDFHDSASATTGRGGGRYRSR